ncbi:MAG: MFS transporter [Promethearchaeota archaeon]
MEKEEKGSSQDLTLEANKTLSKKYFGMFLFYYIVEGSNNGLIASFIPLFLISLNIEGVNESSILTLAGWAMIPFTIKIFWGIISDKFPIGNLGRRRPYISGGILVCGAFWFLMILVVPFARYFNLPILIFLGFTINLGAAISDTALDGLIMDVTPEDYLGRVEGATWACYAIGGGIGGIVGIAIWSFTGSAVPVFILFGSLSLICGIIIWFIKEPLKLKEPFSFEKFKLLFKRARYWSAYFFSFFANFAANTCQIFLTLFFLLKTGVLDSSTTEGLTLLIDAQGNLDLIFLILMLSLTLAIGSMSSSFIFGKMADKFNKKKLYVISVMLSVLLIPLTGLIIQDIVSGLIMSFLVGFSFGSLSALSMAFTAQITQENKETTSTHFSIFTSFMNAGSNVGYIVFAAITAFLLNLLDPINVYIMMFIIAPMFTLFSLFFMNFLPQQVTIKAMKEKKMK